MAAAAQNAGSEIPNRVTARSEVSHTHRLKAHFANWAFRWIVSPLCRRFRPVTVLSPAIQRLGLRLARRANLSSLHIPRIALIWRHADVCEVLGDHERFSVKGYDEKMNDCANPFLLGYDFNNPEYRRDIGLWRGAIKPEDRDRVREIAENRSRDAVARALHKGQIDVVQELVGPVIAGFLNDYFGVRDLRPPQPGELSPLLKTFLDTASYMFSLEILTGPTADQAKKSGAAIQAHLESLIQQRRGALGGAGSTTASAPADTILDRLLRTSQPDDLVRTILGGTVSGVIAVTFSQCLWVIDRLIDLPPVKLAETHHVASDEDATLLGRYVREASRFKPFPPGLLRRCEVEQVVGRGTWYERKIPAGTVVVALTWSAAFDKQVVPHPREFHVGRQDREYLLFGIGQHACPAAQPDRPIAQTLMIQMVKALFALPGLRRAPGAAGFIQTDRSAGRWAEHFMLTFDA